MEGKSFHEFYAAMNMTVRNKLFKKRASHRVSYESGLSKTQTYVLVSGEKCITQHEILIFDFKRYRKVLPRHKET